LFDPLVPVLLWYEKFNFDQLAFHKNSMVDFLQWSDSMVFGFKFISCWRFICSGSTIDGPFLVSDSILSDWHSDYIVPCFGWDMVQHVVSFRSDRITSPISNFKEKDFLWILID